MIFGQKKIIFVLETENTHYAQNNWQGITGICTKAGVTGGHAYGMGDETQLFHAEE